MQGTIGSFRYEKSIQVRKSHTHVKRAKSKTRMLEVCDATQPTHPPPPRAEIPVEMLEEDKIQNRLSTYLSSKLCPCRLEL